MKSLKFVAYYRVSTKKQGIDGLGMEAQRQAVGRYLASLNCELLDAFEEVETGARNSRPKLAEAIAITKKHKAVLVIAKLDRLSRNAAFLLQLQESGIDFVCCDMPNADKFTVGILGLVAQRELELISQRTKAGLAVARERGRKLGNPRPHDSLERGRVTQLASRVTFIQSIMKPIEEIRSTGVSSLAKISEYLNKRGEKTMRGRMWTVTAVKRVLTASE